MGLTMLTEKTVIGQMLIDEAGRINVRTDTVIMRDGVEIHRSHHRKVMTQDDDFSAEAVEVATVAAAVKAVPTYRNNWAVFKDAQTKSITGGAETDSQIDSEIAVDNGLDQRP